jgi:hypothetical protein
MKNINKHFHKKRKLIKYILKLMKSLSKLKTIVMLLITIVITSCEEKEIIQDDNLKKDYLIIPEYQYYIKSAGIFTLNPKSNQNLEYINFYYKGSHLIPKNENNTLFYSENDKDLKITGYSPYSKRAKDYIIPVNIEDQSFDLMTVNTIDVLPKSSKLIFEHQLAKVTFNIYLPLNLKIKDVKITVYNLWKESNYDLIEKRFKEFKKRLDVFTLSNLTTINYGFSGSVLLIPEFIEGKFIVEFIFDDKTIPVYIPKNYVPKKGMETIYQFSIDTNLISTLENVSIINRDTNMPLNEL